MLPPAHPRPPALCDRGGRGAGSQGSPSKSRKTLTLWKWAKPYGSWGTKVSPN